MAGHLLYWHSFQDFSFALQASQKQLTIRSLRSEFALEMRRDPLKVCGNNTFWSIYEAIWVKSVADEDNNLVPKQ